MDGVGTFDHSGHAVLLPSRCPLLSMCDQTGSRKSLSFIMLSIGDMPLTAAEFLHALQALLPAHALPEFNFSKDTGAMIMDSGMDVDEPVLASGYSFRTFVISFDKRPWFHIQYAFEPYRIKSSRAQSG